MSAIVGYLYTFDGHSELLIPDEVETSWFEAHPEMYEPVVLAGKVEKIMDAAKVLMEWQVKNVHVWHNHAYDNMSRVIDEAGQATGILNRVRAETAERCARVCEIYSEPIYGGNVCANAIRALKAGMEAGKC